MVDALRCEVFDCARKCVIVSSGKDKTRNLAYMRGKLRAEPILGDARFGNGLEGVFERVPNVFV